MFSWVLNLLLLIVSLLVAGAPSSPPEANQILKGRCTRCHSEDRLKSQHLDLEGWLDMIERMRAYGANISKDEQMTLASHLVRLYGPRQVKVPSRVYVT